MRARRGWAAGLLVAGLVLLGGPAGAQEQDPCAPGPDGAVPEMCQSGPAPAEEQDPCAPAPDGTVPEMCQSGPAPVEEDPCAVGADGSVPEMCQGGAAPSDPSCAPQPVEPGDGVVTDGDASVSSAGSGGEVEPVATPAPGTVSEDDGVVCAFGAPAVGSAPQEVAPAVAPVSRLPRTGSQDRLLALVALGAGLVVLGAGTAAAARRR